MGPPPGQVGAVTTGRGEHRRVLPNGPAEAVALRTVLTMDGRAWLASYEERLQDIGGRAERAQRALADVEATATSRDGAVTVTVNPAGALQRLELGERSTALTREQLAAAVQSTARQAQAEAARLAAAAVTPLLGEGSAAMAMFRSRLPEDDVR